MNSNVHPLVVALVLVLTGLAIGTWMWGSGAVASIGGPAELRVDRDGYPFVQIQNYLVEHDPNGEYVATYDMEAFGVDVFLGSYGFFSSGDVLLRRGPDPRSFGDNVRAFQRKDNQKSITPETSESGLYRCDLDSGECFRFGERGLDFKAAHGIFIDWGRDDVYISDTTRHVLRKYTAEGTELAGPVEGFKFPNQLSMHDGKVLVADTNHHEIRVVSAETASFGEVLNTIDVVPDLASADRQTWPSHFVRVGKEWWVNNMRTGMNEGGIYIFDDSWQFVRKLGLPEGADPISMIALRDEVWISDWYGDKVRRYSFAGESLGDLQSEGLDSVLERSRLERQKYELISYSGIALIVLVLAGMMVRGVAMGMSSAQVRSQPRNGPDAQTNDADLFLQPDPKLVRRNSMSLRIVGLLIVIAIIGIAYIGLFRLGPELRPQMIWMTLGFVVIFALIVWVGRANTGTAIRIQGRQAMLRDHTGRESTCPVQELRYDNTAVATHDVVIFLGRAHAHVYDQRQLEDVLFPRIADAQKVSAFEMQKILFALRHPQGLSSVLAVVGLVAYAIVTLLE